MNTKQTFFTLIVAALLSVPVMAQDYAVVVNKDNASTLSEKDVSRIFLGKLKAFPDGGKAAPVIQKASSDISQAFIKEILKKRATQYKSYWSKMVFTGKGNPPKELDDDAKVKEVVGSEKDAIGIIKASEVDASVKVVLKF